MRRRRCWPHAFAYLKPQFRDFAALIAALRALPCRALIHAPSLAEPERARLSGPQLRFSETPVRMIEVATHSDLAICHAGHGSVAALLLGGCPLLLLPMQPEQALVARRMEALGAGRAVYPDQAPPDYAQLVSMLLADVSLRAAATAFAARHADFDEARQFARVTECCEALLS
ncbi:MAG: hypothetical protein HZB57_06740 [Gammaproteobacteria bacterium]|nr:hypothetical protein [Gammaproteobacteria bacterium]